ncbi:hypothetical protein WN944_004580 [Citrus x changshan-huyou]|uniref:Uncharacterized protein n=1 Tax=Citrus x changshan-huyou TaxID=2935761 RepID=A0AAP0M480_9ROSI
MMRSLFLIVALLTIGLILLVSYENGARFGGSSVYSAETSNFEQITTTFPILQRKLLVAGNAENPNDVMGSALQIIIDIIQAFSQLEYLCRKHRENLLILAL